MIKTKGKMNEERMSKFVQEQDKILSEIYSNKSTDEYKSHGDITLVGKYKEMEQMVYDLATLKHFPKNEATDLKNIFTTLHRPIFKQMVTEYISKPTERNTLFTLFYTSGYRLLRGELARIYASTEATDKGLVYKPSKVDYQERYYRFIKFFNENIEKNIDEAIRKAHENDNKTKKAFQESGSIVGDIADTILYVGKAIGYMSYTIFKTATAINPISFISSLLSKSYDKKIDKFNYVSAMYFETKKAYEEYMKLPEKDRKQKVEAKYVKNMEKYNIKMKNLQATIEHYDSRALEHAKDSMKSSSVTKTEDKKDSDTSSSENKKEESSTSTTNDDNDDFDF